jgi:hypothetical protein
MSGKRFSTGDVSLTAQLGLQGQTKIGSGHYVSQCHVDIS